MKVYPWRKATIERKPDEGVPGEMQLLKENLMKVYLEKSNY